MQIAHKLNALLWISTLAYAGGCLDRPIQIGIGNDVSQSVNGTAPVRASELEPILAYLRNCPGTLAILEIGEKPYPLLRVDTPGIPAAPRSDDLFSQAAAMDAWSRKKKALERQIDQNLSEARRTFSSILEQPRNQKRTDVIDAMETLRSFFAETQRPGQPAPLRVAILISDLVQSPGSAPRDFEWSEPVKTYQVTIGRSHAPLGWFRRSPIERRSDLKSTILAITPSFVE
jgi:hypothetical protein